MEKANSVSLDKIDYEAFTREIEALRQDAFQSLCHQDFRHLIKIERLGKLCSLLGFATAWIIPNPISAFLIGHGILTRWLLMHHISHGGYDRVPGVQPGYTSKTFARGGGASSIGSTGFIPMPGLVYTTSCITTIPAKTRIRIWPNDTQRCCATFDVPAS
jgi:hypothetical protein